MHGGILNIFHAKEEWGGEVLQLQIMHAFVSEMLVIAQFSGHSEC